jgi:hypothetical protein
MGVSAKTAAQRQSERRARMRDGLSRLRISVDCDGLANLLIDAKILSASESERADLIAAALEEIVAVLIEADRRFNVGHGGPLSIAAHAIIAECRMKIVSRRDFRSRNNNARMGS